MGDSLQGAERTESRSIVNASAASCLHCSCPAQYSRIQYIGRLSTGYRQDHLNWALSPIQLHGFPHNASIPRLPPMHQCLPSIQCPSRASRVPMPSPRLPSSPGNHQSFSLGCLVLFACVRSDTFLCGLSPPGFGYGCVISHCPRFRVTLSIASPLHHLPTVVSASFKT